MVTDIYRHKRLTLGPGIILVMTRRRWIILIVTVALLLTAAGATGLFILHGRNKSHFSAATKQAAGFSLYWPAKLPSGWSADPASVKYNSEATFLTLKSGQHEVIVSEQTVPPTFDFTSFFQQGLQGGSQFTTDIGQAGTGKANGRYVGSLVAGTTWILLSANDSSVTSTDLIPLLKSFEADP